MLRLRRRALLLSLLLLAAALPACRKKPLPAAYVEGARKVLLVGVDGADWTVIDPLIAAGKLPTLARLKAAGNTATLVATPPLVSPILWTTIATGRTPDEHGVLDFMVDLPGGGQAPVGSVHRKVPALWTLFSATNRRVGLVGWWATWPAESVNGTIVSDQLAPQLTRPGADLGAGLVSPATAAGELMALQVQPQQIELDLIRKFAPVTEAEYQAALDGGEATPSRFYSNRTAHLAAILAGTYTYMVMGERLLREQQPELTAVYLEAVDSVSHRFVKDPASGRAAIEQAYVEVDTALGRLAAAASPDTWVIVCSDHGFYAADSGLTEDPAQLSGPATAWHRPYGIAAAAEAGALAATASPAPASPGPAPPSVVTPLDIAPTVLHAAGLQVDPAMTGRVAEALLPPTRRGSKVVRKAYVLPSAAAVTGDLRSAAIDEAALARLQALGYAGSRPSSLAMQNLGESLYRGGKLDAAERALRSAVEAQPQNLAAWLWLARTLHARGRTQEALAAWGEALKLPEGATALLPAVEAAAADGRQVEGRTLIAKATGAPPAAMHTARAVLAQAGQRTAEAERELRLALKADPTYFEALFRLFDVLHQGGRSKQALPMVERAAKAVPGSPRHGALLGEALLAAGDFQGAERALARALEQAPDSAPVRLDLARAELSHGHADGALETLAPAPPSPERSVLMGAASSVLGRWADAGRHYQDALTAREPTVEVLNGLGWALHKQGRNREAADALRRSLALRADQPQIQKLLETFGS
jgi:tetratricopeptide (TPR) repeat protein